MKAREGWGVLVYENRLQKCFIQAEPRKTSVDLAIYMPCSTVMETERVEEVATPGVQGDHHQLAFPATRSTFYSPVQFFVFQHKRRHKTNGLSALTLLLLHHRLIDAVLELRFLFASSSPC